MSGLVRLVDEKGASLNFSKSTATEVLSEITAGRLAPSELMEATLAQIEAVNGDINAIVSLRDGEDLIAEASAADNAKGGPLHGLPIAIKDLAMTKGLRSTMGSPLFADQVPAADELMVARIRAAGAIIIGKTNTPEFGLGSHTFNPVHGATRNPYDLTKSAGGSSGGAAAALAARMLLLADGSDMMGSLRNPAGWNNVYGFRPSWGRVPKDAVGELFLQQLSTEGPMARCPQDLALLLDVIAGPNPLAPHGMHHDPMHGKVTPETKQLRLGWLADWGGAYPMELGILDISETALSAFEALGHGVDPLNPPFSAEAIWESWITLRSWAVAGGMAPLYADKEKRQQLKPAAIWEIERGNAMSAMEVNRAGGLRSEWFIKAAQLFETYDVLVLPSAQVWPFDIDLVSPDRINGKEMDTYHRWMETVVPAGLIGLPVLNVPIGFSDSGLPAGLQLIGRKGADLDLLKLGEAWHQATDWPNKAPPPCVK